MIVCMLLLLFSGKKRKKYQEFPNNLKVHNYIKTILFSIVFFCLFLLVSYIKMPLLRNTLVTWPFCCHNTLTATIVSNCFVLDQVEVHKIMILFLRNQGNNYGCPKRGLIHRDWDSSVIRPLLYLQASMAGSGQ